jgi:hypothetical protein
MERVPEGLEKGEHQIFDHLFKKARFHSDAGICTSNPCPFETILTSVLLHLLNYPLQCFLNNL